MKKKVIPVLVVLVLILIVIGVMVATYMIGKYTPSTETADLAEQYSITRDDQVAIILDQRLIDTQAKLINGHVYLDYNYLYDNFNDRFYWDSNENILLYATSKELISVPADSTSYQVNKNTIERGYPIVKATADSAYVDLELIASYTDITYSYFENPSRVVITSKWDKIKTAVIKKDTQLRVLGGIKSKILAELAKDDKVTIMKSGNKWSEVLTEDGKIGYVENKLLDNQMTETLQSDFVPDTYEHPLKKNFEICMAWHQVRSRSANNDLASLLKSTKGINVISPTWFYIKDNKGNLLDLASADYVTECHQNNIEVWAMVTNIIDDNLVANSQEVSSAYILTHTSSRQNLVNQIVSTAIQYNLDGINLDFESLSPSKVGDSYIQFVRELSIKCANNDIILSVDNYVPSEYTAFYNRKEQALYADYVVIMGYDEHYHGSEEGSVASLSWVREGVANTLASVPANQIILGIPFYNRIWMKTPNNEETPDDSENDDSYILYDLDSYACGMSAANKLITSNNAEKTWLEDCGQYYVQFEASKVIYQIWLEDPASVEEKLKVVDANELAGASFWKLGLETNETWDTVIKYIN